MSTSSFLSFIQISYPSSTSYGKTAQSTLDSFATQTKSFFFYNGRDRVILYGTTSPTSFDFTLLKNYEKFHIRPFILSTKRIFAKLPDKNLITRQFLEFSLRMIQNSRLHTRTLGGTNLKKKKKLLTKNLLVLITHVLCWNPISTLINSRINLPHFLGSIRHL